MSAGKEADRPRPDGGRSGGEDEFALLVHQAGDERLLKYLTLVLSYLYGLNALLARRMSEASTLLMERGEQIRCTFVIQAEPITSQTALSALGLRGGIPLFLLLPEEMVRQQRELGGRNIFVCAWENAAAAAGQNLRHLIDEAFERNDIGGLFDGARHLSYRAMQQRVQRRLRHLNTLPTLPEVVLRILEVTNDQQASVDAVQEVLLGDTAVVHKLLQVVNTTEFAGTGQRGRWELREAIVRLGRRRIGSIALQIKLINSLVQPGDSGFALHRFWMHSVSCAMVCDVLYRHHLLRIEDWESCEDYWVAALLHDVGRLILGFFFWSYYEEVQRRVQEGEGSFRSAERAMGDLVTHPQVGQLLLLRAGTGPEVAAAVAEHHDPQVPASSLVCLVHLADNLSKDLGLGYASSEGGVYHPAVLQAVGLDEAGLEVLRQELRATVLPQVEELVNRCRG